MLAMIFPEKLLGRLLVVFLTTFPFASAENGATEALPPIDEIVEKALARAERQKKLEIGRALVAELTKVTERLDDEGATESKEEIVFLESLHDGHYFHEKVLVNGRKLTPKEANDEKARKEKFLREIERNRGNKSHKPRGDRVEFNRELVERYRAKLAGRETVHGREAYVIEFDPRRGKLPVRRRTDYALNKSNGRVWIDTEDYGIARVEFHLLEPVHLWYGILGNVTVADGLVETIRNEEGFWLPREMKIYMDGRILFTSLHHRSRRKWRYPAAGESLSADH